MATDASCRPAHGDFGYYCLPIGVARDQAVCAIEELVAIFHSCRQWLLFVLVPSANLYSFGTDFTRNCDWDFLHLSCLSRDAGNAAVWQ